MTTQTQPDWAAWAEEDAAPVIRRTPSFVTPGPAPAAIVRRETPPASIVLDTPLPIQQQIRMVTSHTDRAKGFTLVSLPMAMGVGLGGLLLAIGRFKVPLWSMGALLVLFLAFLATWLLAWLWFTAASPDGIGLMQVLLHYRLLRHEQRARLRRMDEP
jgi:hypothetical protein